MPVPTRENLLKVFEHDPVAGTILHKETGEDALTYTELDNGYMMITIMYEGNVHRATDIMWLLEGRKLSGKEIIYSDDYPDLPYLNIDRLVPKFDIVSEKKQKSEAKGYTFDKSKNRYRVFVKDPVTNKYVSGGTFKNEIEAALRVSDIRTGFIKMNPPKKRRENIPKYIHLNKSGTYKVVLPIDGKQKHIGTRETIKEAKALRDEKMMELK